MTPDEQYEKWQREIMPKFEQCKIAATKLGLSEANAMDLGTAVRRPDLWTADPVGDLMAMCPELSDRPSLERLYEECKRIMGGE